MPYGDGGGTGGVGNPGGYNGSYYDSRSNSGTGGLLIVFSDELTGSGSFVANGTDALGWNYDGNRRCFWRRNCKYFL